MAQFFFRALPVITAKDATMDFEQLTFALNNGDIEVNAKGELKVATAAALTGAWTNVEALSAKLESSVIQVRTEGSKAVARLKGTAKAKEAIPASTPLFTLPTGFRPAVLLRALALNITGGTLLVLLIKENGVVENVQEIPNANFIDVDTITFTLT